MADLLDRAKQALLAALPVLLGVVLPLILMACNQNDGGGGEPRY